jgi:hypothetical protein
VQETCQNHQYNTLPDVEALGLEDEASALWDSVNEPSLLEYSEKSFLKAEGLDLAFEKEELEKASLVFKCHVYSQTLLSLFPGLQSARYQTQVSIPLVLALIGTDLGAEILTF